MDANAVSDAEDSVTEEDFIPLDAKKPVVGVKKKKKKKRQANEGGRYESRSLDPKLQDRIRSYLEKNKHLEFIDIEKMSSFLHGRYPEYGRRKVNIFERQVNESFNMLLKNNYHLETEGSDVREDREAGRENGDVEDNAMKVKRNMNDALANLYKPKIGVDQQLDQPNDKPPPRKNVSTDPPTKSALMTALVEDDALLKKRPGPLSKKLKQEQPPTVGTTNYGISEGNNRDVSRVSSSNSLPEVISIDDDSGDDCRPQNKAVIKPTQNSGMMNVPEAANQDIINNSVLNLTKKSLRSKKASTSPYSLVRPTETFKDIGGCEKAIENIFDAASRRLFPDSYLDLGPTPPPQGCVLHGPPGCGKTLLAKAVAGTLEVSVLAVTGTELISGISGNSESKIRDLFEQAKTMAPCILLIDGLDVIAKKNLDAQKEMEVRITRQLIACLDGLKNPSNPLQERVFVIGVTDRLEIIDSAVRTGQRLEREIAMGIPDVKARRQILEVMCKGVKLHHAIDHGMLATLTPGYVGSDLHILLSEAEGIAQRRFLSKASHLFISHQGREAEGKELLDFAATNDEGIKNLRSNSETICLEDFEKALNEVKPSALKEGFSTVPNISFDDIGALDDIRHELKMAICAPAQLDPEKVSQLGLDTPSGVLLYGPPGCGKTLLAKAVANQAGINFISVKGPEIINKYVGESERAVREVFQRARNSAPCVIFFDEIDSICPSRSSGSSDGGSGSNRLVNQLLTEMDGLEGRKGVYVMGATNRKEMLDEAILRPGRLTNKIFVDLPSADGRIDILCKLTRNGTRPPLAPEIDLTKIGRDQRCQGFSGADLGNLVHRAAQARMEEMLLASDKDDLSTIVSERHFEKAFQWVKPSVRGKQKRRYDEMRKIYQEEMEGTVGVKRAKANADDSSKK